MENVLKYLVYALENPEQRPQIGKKIVQEQLQKLCKATHPKEGANFGMALVFKPGDVVPTQFRGIPGLVFNEHGVLINGWQDSWHHIDNGWPRDWPNNSIGDFDPGVLVNKNPTSGIHFNSIPQVKAFDPSKFSEKEIEVLKRFGIGS